MRPFPRAAAVLTLTLAFASVAAADEPEPARPIAARRARSTGVPAMLIGGGVFALGYVIELAAMSYGALTTAQEVGKRKPTRPPVATWQPTTSSIPGGATLGVLSTF